MGLLYPAVFPSLPDTASDLMRARHALNGLVYVCVILLDVGAMAIVGAREIRTIIDEYRERRKHNLEQFLEEISKVKSPSKRTNGSPLE